MTVKDIETTLRRYIDVTRPHAAPKTPEWNEEQLREGLFDYLFRDLIPTALGTCSKHALYVFDGKGNLPYVFDKAVEAKLLELHENVKETLENAMSEYRSQVKVMSAASKRYYAIQYSKTVNDEKKSAAADAANHEHEVLLTEFAPALFEAQLAERYERMVLPAYKSQNIEDAMWGILTVLRNEAVNPRSNRHAEIEKFLEDNFIS